MYEIAYHLRMPLYILKEEMPYEEYAGWAYYFSKRPIDWRADDRTYKILQTQGAKEKPWVYFPSLRTIYNEDVEVKEGAKGLVKSPILKFLMHSVGGDRINFTGVTDGTDNEGFGSEGGDEGA